MPQNATEQWAQRLVSFTVAQYVGFEELKDPVTEFKLDSLAEMSCAVLSNLHV